MKMWQLSGIFLIITGIIHNFVGLIMGSSVLISMWQEGLFNTVGAQYDRNAIFWFLFSGILFIMVGHIFHWYIRKENKLLATFMGWYLLGLALIGCFLAPISGLWLLFPQALILIKGDRQFHILPFLDSRYKTLIIGGSANIIIAFLHIFGLIWAESMFQLTGIEQLMRVLSEIHLILPYFLTVLVALVFLLFGLTGLVRYQNNAFQLILIFFIGVIYSIRGIGGLFILIGNISFFSLELLYSLIATLIGYLYFDGGFKLYRVLKNN